MLEIIFEVIIRIIGAIIALAFVLIIGFMMDNTEGDFKIN